MKKKKKAITISIISIIAIICLVLIVLMNRKNNKCEMEENWENPYTELNKEEVEYQDNISINEIKEELGMKADNDLYEVNTEYDGRKVLNIKANIQYKVAFAGIIKQKIPQMDEVDKIVNENHPSENGVWIEEQSRDKFLEILKENTNSEYKINENGYLTIENKKQQNDNDKKLEKMIHLNKKIILTINNFYYEVDNVTGEIVEYPFEKLDNYQVYDKITYENNSIIVITTNLNNKLTNKEILEELVQAEN